MSRSVFIAFAHAATATVHLWWSDLPKTAILSVRTCLATPSVGMLERTARLHVLVLLSFAVALSFRVTSAHQLQAGLTSSSITLTVGCTTSAKSGFSIDMVHSLMTSKRPKVGLTSHPTTAFSTSRTSTFSSLQIQS